MMTGIDGTAMTATAIVTEIGIVPIGVVRSLTP
jgi:hypothetical protein